MIRCLWGERIVEDEIRRSLLGVSEPLGLQREGGAGKAYCQGCGKRVDLTIVNVGKKNGLDCQCS